MTLSNLPPEEMRADNIPRAVWTGTFRIFGVDLKCAVLDNGQRIIDADNVNELFAVMSEPNTEWRPDDPGLIAFAKWRRLA